MIVGEALRLTFDSDVSSREGTETLPYDFGSIYISKFVQIYNL